MYHYYRATSATTHNTRHPEHIPLLRRCFHRLLGKRGKPQIQYGYITEQQQQQQQQRSLWKGILTL